MDGGKEYSPTELTAFCCACRIQLVTTAPYSPHQNGVVERGIQEVLLIIRTFHIQTGIPEEFWPWICQASVDTSNSLPHSAVPGKTPV
jgi:hypothetical protein